MRELANASAADCILCYDAQAPLVGDTASPHFVVSSFTLPFHTGAHVNDFHDTFV